MTRPSMVLVVGVVAALLSAAGTYLYLVSLFIYPLLVLLFVWALVAIRRVGRPRPSRATYGLALATSALLMPLAAGLGNWVFTSIDRSESPQAIATGEPVFIATFTPAILILVLCLVYARWRASTTPRQGRGSTAV